MIGRLKELTFGRNGEQIISLTVRADARELFDSLKDADVSIEIKKYRKHRSLDANAYCWVLCDKIADKLCDDGEITTKEDVYRESIREIGVYKDFPNMAPDDAKTLRHAWQMLGTGWVTEQVDYSQDGECVTVRCYYGSSQYNTKQMSRLIDNLVQDCRELGIETDTPEQIEKIKSLWAQAPKEKEQKHEQEK